MTESAKVHAVLGASSAHRWMNCPGSIRLIATMPWEPPASSYAEEGTAMHLAAEQWLNSDLEPDWEFETFNGISLAPDCVEAVNDYRDTLLDDRAKYGGSLLVERKFNLDTLRPGMFGTNDACLVLCNDKVLRIYDFKGGAGVPVEVEGNPQLMYYGYGALLKYSGKYEIVALELVVVQPRCPHRDGPVRRWRVDLIDAFDWAQDLVEAANATDDPKAPLHAGDWCRWCPAAGSCKEHKKLAERQIDADFDVIEETPFPDPRLMDPAEIAALLPKLSIAEDWIRLVREFAHAEAEAGRVLPGFKLVPKRGRRQWIASDDLVVQRAIGLGLNKADCFTQKICSPNQLEKLLPKAKRADLTDLWNTVSSGTTLVPDGDARPEITTGAAQFEALPAPDDGGLFS